MSIESQFARQAYRLAYHQLATEDTQADLNEWLSVVYSDQLELPPNDEWIKDITGGTCTYWDVSASGYIHNYPLAVGDYLVQGYLPKDTASFEQLFFTP